MALHRHTVPCLDIAFIVSLGSRLPCRIRLCQPSYFHFFLRRQQQKQNQQESLQRGSFTTPQTESPYCMIGLPFPKEFSIVLTGLHSVLGFLDNGGRHDGPESLALRSSSSSSWPRLCFNSILVRPSTCISIDRDALREWAIFRFSLDSSTVLFVLASSL